MKVQSIIFWLAALVIPGIVTPSGVAAQKVLPSWNDGKTRSAIIQFVDRVTDPAGNGYVPAAERIAVFDNDGTLWSEQPIYFQLAFAVDRIRQLADKHPEWRNQQPFQAAIEGDMQTLFEGGEHALLELVMASHAGNTTEEFAIIVDEWIRSARHPVTGRLYKEMVFQPMLELLDYLRANEFQTWIVSGGGIGFMRPWAGEVYGVPPEQVIGSSIKTKFEIRDGRPVLTRLPEIDFFDDKADKPVAIHKFIGRCPIAAFGNSDGDLQMLQWTTAGEGIRFGLLVHHTDDQREWAYDRDSSIGRLDVALDQARDKGWVVADMQQDWAVIYPFQKLPEKSPQDEDEHHYFSKNEHSPTVHWGYQGDTGPAYWGRLDKSWKLADTGRQQSPVNIDSKSARRLNLPDLTFDYRQEQISTFNNGHTIQHDESPGSFMFFGDRKYALEQFHVHTPSEHTVDGKPFDLELHFVHKSEKGRVAVVAVLFEADNNGTAEIPGYYTLPNQKGETVLYRGRRNPADFLPRSREYYTYDGSFTTPPCTEGVKWIVMKQPVKVKPGLIERFRAILNSNNRPTQKLNARKIRVSR